MQPRNVEIGPEYVADLLILLCEEVGFNFLQQLFFDSVRN